MQTIQVHLKGDFYTCDIGITKEEWLTILQDKKTKDSFREALLCFYYLPGHRGSCYTTGKRWGKKANALNILISKFGDLVKKRFKGRFEVVGLDGKPTYWIIPMDKGKILNNHEEGTFEWELRKELVEAINDYLYWYLVEQYKRIRLEKPLHHTEDENEFYKWQLITACQNKTPLEIITNHVSYPSKAWKGGFVNLIDASRDNKSLKHLLVGKSEELEKVLNNLANEAIPLNERLFEYKSSMASLFPSEGFGSKANDERTAATILTCLNPLKYTFYKRYGLYDRFCNYLGVEMQKSGLCYTHYLTLLRPLAESASKDIELQAIIEPSLSDMIKSDLLLAQDILWLLMGRYANRLGYIYNLLFNTNKNMEDNNKINEYIQLLEANHNLILTGAPGTGKTYLAKKMAAQMINVGDIDELVGNEQFGFVQFHPSYDYTDFVEGLRPKQDENGNVGFERKDGIFKEFCAKAIAKYESKNFDEAYNELTESIDDTVLNLKTPRGADFGVSVNSRGNLKLHTGNELKDQGVLTRENIKAQFAGMSAYKYWRGYYEGVITFLKQKFNLQQTENDSNKKYVFVVDEINRGEISKILGELFFSIDPGYRGTSGRVKTQYQNMVEEGDVFKKGFYVPENVYIIGTMNDIDRSVESMDFAMRRRFAWKEVTAKDSMVMFDDNDKLIAVDAPVEEIKARMSHLNDAIVGDYKYKDEKYRGKEKIQGLNKSFQIGAAYFLKYANYSENDNAFEDLWNFHLNGLLAEYLRGNVDVEGNLKMLKEAYDDNNYGQQSRETSATRAGEDSSAFA